MNEKKTILELLEIEEQYDEEHRRYHLSIKFGYCPECGAKIISEPIEKLEVPVKKFFGLIKVYTKTWAKRNICSQDKKHYEEKYEESDIW